MKIVIGTEYVDGRGNRVNIMGATRDNPDWLWSLRGNWYAASSGKFVWTDSKTFSHHLLAKQTPHDIVKEKNGAQ